MNSTLIMQTPATGLSCYVAGMHSAHTAPVWSEQGTGVSFAGTSLPVDTATPVDAVTPVAQVAFGARVTSLPGFPPRGAPV